MDGEMTRTSGLVLAGRGKVTGGRWNPSRIVGGSLGRIASNGRDAAGSATSSISFPRGITLPLPLSFSVPSFSLPLFLAFPLPLKLLVPLTLGPFSLQSTRDVGLFPLLLFLYLVIVLLLLETLEEGDNSSLDLGQEDFKILGCRVLGEASFQADAQLRGNG